MQHVNVPILLTIRYQAKALRLLYFSLHSINSINMSGKGTSRKTMVAEIRVFQSLLWAVCLADIGAWI